MIKKKTNPIPSSLREKKRYVYFKLSFSQKINSKHVYKAVWDSLLALFGAIGSSQIGFQLIEFDSSTGKGIARCIRGKENELKTAIVLVKSVQNIKVLPEILRVSGTLKSIRGAK